MNQSTFQYVCLHVNNDNFFFYVAFSEKHSINVELFNMTSSTDGVYQTIQEKTSLSENAKLKKIKQNDLSPTFSWG